MPDPAPQPFNLSHWLVNVAVRSYIGALRLLPYRLRVPVSGWLVRKVGTIGRYKARAISHLEMIYPDRSPQVLDRIATQVLDNVGRTMIEGYSYKGLSRQVADTPITGPGFEALQTAKAEGRAVLFTTGHFGNHDAARVALNMRGFDIGGLYRPMKNTYLNAQYVDTLKQVGGSVFPQGKEGMRGFMAHLSGGGQLTLLFDVYFARGVSLSFLGKPAMTSLAVAELAMRFDAVIIPYFARRLPDGMNFEITMDAPIEYGDATDMMVKITEGLERRIDETPEQWFWIHRRWKS